jgi:hypothetical protein
MKWNLQLSDILVLRFSKISIALLDEKCIMDYYIYASVNRILQIVTAGWILE